MGSTPTTRQLYKLIREMVGKVMGVLTKISSMIHSIYGLGIEVGLARPKIDRSPYELEKNQERVAEVERQQVAATPKKSRQAKEVRKTE